MTFSPALFDQIKSILFVPYNPNPVGDGLVTLTHLRQIQALFPQAKLSLTICEDNIPLIEMENIEIEYVTQAFFFDKDLLTYHKHWDLIIIESAILLPEQFLLYCFIGHRLLLINEHISFFNSFEKGDFSTPNLEIYYSPINPDCHMIDRISQSLIGQNAPTPKFYLPPHPLTPTIIKTMWQSRRLRVLLSPVGAKKQISVEEFAEILNGINPDLHNKIDFLLLHFQGAQEYYNQLLSFTSGINIRLAPQTDLTHYMALVDSSDFVISVDTSCVHLATAYSKPLAAFYSNCPAKLAHWKPVPNNAPTLLALGKNLSENELDTSNFNHQAVCQWVNTQLAQLIEQKQL